MKPIRITCEFLTIVTFLILAAGCASNNLIDKENAAVGAGFKVITPTKPAQQALLRKLPADKVTRINFGGKTYFILPDRVKNRAYVGGPKQYQAYQQFRRTQQMNTENYEATPDPIQIVEINSMNWGEWDGWVAVGGPDGIGWPGWY